MVGGTGLPVSAVEFDMSEVTALADELAKAAPAAHVISSAQLTKIAAQLKADAQAAAPVDTGELKASIKSQGGKDYRIVKATADHSFFVEFGTSDTPPQPFLWPQAPRASQRLAQALGSIDPFNPLTTF